MTPNTENPTAGGATSGVRAGASASGRNDLDALALERAVDAGWTSTRRPAKPHHDTVSRPHRRRRSAGGGRSVDVEGETGRDAGRRKGYAFSPLCSGERGERV